MFNTLKLYKKMKAEIYNLIILDESGSMGCIRRQTISGCNETLNTIRSAQEKFADTQDHYVSIYVFQGDNEKKPSQYIVKNQPIAQTADINDELYTPWGSTPLYDAVGSTLADLKAVVKEKEMAIGNVTIITDGMENASKYYTREKVVQMIDALKEIGWSFNFIGANINVQQAASDLHIDNSLAFKQDEKGTVEMFVREKNSRMSWLKRTHAIMSDEAMACCATPEGRSALYEQLKESASNYFEEEEEPE